MTEHKQKVYFGIFPNSATRRKIQCRIDSEIGGLMGRPKLPENWHVTLANAGRVEPAAISTLIEIDDHLSAQSFTLHLDRVGLWSRNQVMWLAPSATPTSLNMLAEELSVGLESFGYKQAYKPYNPHLTLARNVSGGDSARPIMPIRWMVAEFAWWSLGRQIEDRFFGALKPGAFENRRGIHRLRALFSFKVRSN